MKTRSHYYHQHCSPWCRPDVLTSQWAGILSGVHHVCPLGADDLLSDFWDLEPRGVNHFHKEFKIQKFRLAVEWPSSFTEMLSSVAGIAMQETLFFPRWEEKSRKMLFYLRFHSLFRVLSSSFGKCTFGRRKPVAGVSFMRQLGGGGRGLEWGGLLPKYQWILIQPST